MTTSGTIHKISISSTKGTKKQNVASVEVRTEYGIVGDAHAGSGRQVSLLPLESFDKMKNNTVVINPGDFAENITTIGLDFTNLKVGQCFNIGRDVRLEVSQIGKECHHGCYIRQAVGDCIMPREGIFARVLSGGTINVGDKILWIST